MQVENPYASPKTTTYFNDRRMSWLTVVCVSIVASIVYFFFFAYVINDSALWVIKMIGPALKFLGQELGKFYGSALHYTISFFWGSGLTFISLQPIRYFVLEKTKAVITALICITPTLTVIVVLKDFANTADTIFWWCYVMQFISGFILFTFVLHGRAKSLFVSLIFSFSFIGFARVIFIEKLSEIDNWLAIPCFFGLLWASCHAGSIRWRSVIAQKGPLLPVLLLAVTYELASRYFQLHHIKYPFLANIFIELSLAFFIGFLSRRTNNGLLQDGLIFLPIYLIWIAICISAAFLISHSISFEAIWGIIGAASIFAPIPYIFVIAGLYFNGESRSSRRRYVGT
jgi:hypothetical protein